MLRDIRRVAVVALALGALVAAAGVARADDTASPPPQKPVSLTINPDGSAVWNGEPLPSEPALKNKIARQTQQSPKLELDLRFHTVGGLDESNRQTLMDIVELTAKFGFVHVETTDTGAKLTVLGPAAAEAAPPK